MHVRSPNTAIHFTNSLSQQPSLPLSLSTQRLQQRQQQLYSTKIDQQQHESKRDSWDYNTCLNHAKVMYEKHVLHDDKDGFVDWERECQMLLAKVLGLRDYSVSTFFAQMRRSGKHRDQTLFLNLTAEQQQHYCRLVKERCEQRKPLDYVLQTASFYAHTFEVNEHVLIPRSDSERLVDTALDIIHREYSDASEISILDIGTGSGCLILSVVHEVIARNQAPAVKGVGIDKSSEALAVAQKNALNIIPERYRESCIVWLQEDIMQQPQSQSLTPLKHAPFDMVISNPPYIRTEDIDSLDKEVRCHEPHMALDGGKDGLDFYRTITRLCGGPEIPLLRTGGYILFEVGYDQSEAVQEIIRASGYLAVEDVVRDYSDIERVVVARKQ